MTEEHDCTACFRRHEGCCTGCDCRKPERVRICNLTGKVRFPTEEIARTELVGALLKKNRGNNRRKERRVYQCRACGGGWHMTSMPLLKPKAS